MVLLICLKMKSQLVVREYMSKTRRKTHKKRSIGPFTLPLRQKELVPVGISNPRISTWTSEERRIVGHLVSADKETSFNSGMLHCAQNIMKLMDQLVPCEGHIVPLLRKFPIVSSQLFGQVQQFDIEKSRLN